MKRREKCFVVPRIALSGYAALSDQRLQILGRQVDASEKLPRSSWAGRALISAVFQEFEIQSKVYRDKEHGFLRADQQVPFLSLAHTQSVAAVALGATPLGVDVEPLQRDASRVLTRIGTSKEQARSEPFLSVSHAEVSFPLALWCAKEAMAKAIGVGVGGRWPWLQVDWDNPRQGLYSVNYECPGPFRIQTPVLRFHVYHDHLVALVGEQSAVAAAKWLPLTLA